MRETVENPEPTFTPAKEIATLEAAREIFAMGLDMLRECRGDVHYWEKLAPGVNGALANLIEAERLAQNA